MAKRQRIKREEWYYEFAKLTAKRSTCSRKQVGCIFVVDKRIVAQGYNGVLPGVDPSEGLDEEGNSKTTHAEANAIAFCAKHGIPIDEAIVYCTLQPCYKCAELLIQAGVKEVHFWEEYRDESGLQLLMKHNIKVFYRYAKCL